MQARNGAYPQMSRSVLALDLPVQSAARTAAAQACACTEACHLTGEAPDLPLLTQTAARGPPTFWSNTASGHGSRAGGKFAQDSQLVLSATCLGSNFRADAGHFGAGCTALRGQLKVSSASRSVMPFHLSR